MKVYYVSNCPCRRSCARIVFRNTEKASAHTYEKNGETFFVSISIGVKEFSHCEDHDFMGFLDHVDQEMYRVKREKK